MLSFKKCTAIFESMQADRSDHDEIVQDVQDLVLPYRGDITGDWSVNADRMGPTFDATGVVALSVLASYLQGAIFSPGTPWLRLGISGKASPSVEEQQALDEAADEIMAYLDDSNFYSVMNNWLKDIAGIGNATLLVEERGVKLREDGSTLGGLDFEAVPFARIWRILDRFGRPIVVAREVEMTQWEAEEFFSKDMKEPEEGTRKIKFRNLIKKFDDKIFSYWWREGESEYLTEPVELDYFPYLSAMWDKVDGHSYGYGQGMLVRPCIAGMQELARQTIQAVGRELNPLLAVEHDSFIDTDVANNGVLTLKRSITRDPRFITSGSNFIAADQIRRLDKEQVERAFFADVLFPPPTQERSAEATRARLNTVALRMAGPGQNVALHLSDIAGTVMQVIRLRGGLQSLDGINNVKPVFVSPFFSAARQSIAESINQFVAQQAQIAALVQDPEFMDAIDMSKVADVVARNSDVPATVLRTEEELSQMREVRAQRAAEQRVNEATQAGSLPGGELSTQLELGGRNLPGV